MTQTLLWLFGTYALLVATWALYLAVMNLQAHLPGMGPVAKAHGYVLLVVAVVFDALVNVVICSLLFMDLPREWLLTARLKRYIALAPATWRTRMARWIGHHLLDQFDPRGRHI